MFVKVMEKVIMSRKVLVLGCTGEIGGRVARLCAEAGHSVWGVCRGKKQRFTDTGDKVIVKNGDKKDEDFLRSLDAEFHPQVVIDTVPWMGAVARYARCFPGVENIFICGSTGKYVPLQFLPADETHPWREDKGVNFYNQSLMDAELFDLWEKQGIPGTIFSPTNIIGEGVIPLELWGGRSVEFWQTLRASEPIDIPPCENVLVQSGYNWDLASAFAKAVDYPDKVRGQQYVISSRKAIPLSRYLRRAMDFLGSKSEVRVVSCEKLMELHPSVKWVHGLDFLMEHMCFDIGKAMRDFGYSPTHTTEQGLVKALAWCTANGKF